MKVNNAELIDQFNNSCNIGKSLNTQATYTQSLGQFAAYLAESGTDLASYSRTDVQLYINHLQGVRKRAASGVNLVFAAIRLYSRWANKPDAIEGIRIVKAAKLIDTAPQWLDKNTRNKLIRETDRKPNKRDHAIVMTLLGCGLRVSELAVLDKDDLTMGERSGHVDIRNGKGGKARRVNIPAETRHAIKAYLEQRTDDMQAVFTSQLGKRISVRTIQAMLSGYDVSPHQLRHTFVKTLVDQGQSLATIMSLSGHSSAEMVAWYSQPTNDEKQSAVDNIFV